MYLLFDKMRQEKRSQEKEKYFFLRNSWFYYRFFYLECFITADVLSKYVFY